MDFIVGLPNTSWHHDSIRVIVDRLTKTTHFLPVHTTHRTEKYAEIYIDQIVRLHGILRTIVLDRGAPFVARFWEQLCDTPGVSFVLSQEIYPNLGCSVKNSISRSCLSLFIRLSHGSSPNSELFDREKQSISERVKTFISRNECKLDDQSRFINLI